MTLVFVETSEQGDGKLNPFEQRGVQTEVAGCFFVNHFM